MNVYFKFSVMEGSEDSVFSQADPSACVSFVYFQGTNLPANCGMRSQHRGQIGVSNQH